MNIPLLDIKAQLDPLYDEIMAAVRETVESTRYILGPKVESFEANIAAYCQTKQAIGVSSGTDALLASLMAVGVVPGDFVLTTPYTFFATMGTILRLGAQPVFADIDPLTFNIDPDKVEEFFAQSPYAEKVKAIMPVHLFGQCADMDPLLKIARERELPVVEDAAQAIGASYPSVVSGDIQWHRAGSMGDCGCFSFFPSKNLGGMGDAGMVVTSDSQLADWLRLIRVHGDITQYHHAIVGGNFRLDAMQAAILDVKLKYLNKWHADRRSNAAYYNKLFENAGLVKDGCVVLPEAVYEKLSGEENRDFHIYNQYVIRVKDRNKLKDFLQRQSVGVAVYYPIPLHNQNCVADLAVSRQRFPEAEKAALETLALPIYPELTDEMQEYVVEQIRDFYKI